MAVSRIQEIVELPSEEEAQAQRSIPLLIDEPDEKDDESGDKKEKIAKGVDSDWITAGSVLFQNVVLKYKPDLPPALNDVSFRVQGGQKVGIVGRTGCGKSTVLQALFRMVRLPDSITSIT